MSKSHMVTVRLNADGHADFNELAEIRGVSVSKLVRDLVAETLEKERAKSLKGNNNEAPDPLEHFTPKEMLLEIGEPIEVDGGFLKLPETVVQAILENLA